MQTLNRLPLAEELFERRAFSSSNGQRWCREQIDLLKTTFLMLLVCLAHDLVSRRSVHLKGVHRLLDVDHADCRLQVGLLALRCYLPKVEIPELAVCSFLQANLKKEETA